MQRSVFRCGNTARTGHGGSIAHEATTCSWMAAPAAMTARNGVPNAAHNTDKKGSYVMTRKQARWKSLLGIALLASSVAHAWVDDMSSASGWSAPSWAPGSATPALDTTGGVTGVSFGCDFSAVPSDPDRCLWLKNYGGADLSTTNAIEVTVDLLGAEHMRALSFYMNLPSSVGGGTGQSWHATYRDLLVEGTQTFTILLSELAPQTCSGGSCNALQSFNGLTDMELLAWRKAGSTAAVNVKVDHMESVNVPVIVLQNEDPNYTKLTTAPLDRYGIKYVVVEKTKFPSSYNSLRNPLNGAKIILTNNVVLNATQADFLADHLSHTSSKLIAYGPTIFPAGDNTLKELLGVGDAAGGTVYDAKLIHFNSTGQSLLGVPEYLPGPYEDVYVKSVAVATPATVLAQWNDNSGKPAWVVNGFGGYRDKIMGTTYHAADDDRIQLAMMIYLQPSMAAEIIAGVRARFDTIGGYGSFANAVTAIGTELGSRPGSARKTAAQGHLTAAQAAYTAAGSATTAIAELNKLFDARRQLVEAYAELATSANSSEIRAAWMASGLGAYIGDWGTTLDYLSAYGVTHVVSNAVRGVVAIYDSDYLCTTANPLSSTNLCFTKDTTWASKAPSLNDPLAASIDEAHERNMKLVVWKNDFSLSIPDGTAKTWWLNSGYLQLQYQPWTNTYVTVPSGLTACAEDIRDMDVRALTEIATDYDVDGIQLDFIRFADKYSSYDNHCKVAFGQFLTAKGSVHKSKCEDNPSSTPYNPELWARKATAFAPEHDNDCVNEFQEFRTKVITDHVKRIRDMIKNINDNRPPTKPYIELSAATFPKNPEFVAQDWPSWSYSHWLDRAFPMAYSSSLALLQDNVYSAVAKIPNVGYTNTEIPLNFGIGFEALPEDFIEQISWLRTAEDYSPLYSGFSLFQINEDFLDNTLPTIAKTLLFHDVNGDGVHDDVDHCNVDDNPSETDVDDDNIADRCEHGLTASFYNNTDMTGTPVAVRIDDNIDFDWNVYSPMPGTVDIDEFSVSWNGRVVPPVTGTYEFCTTTDDGVWLSIDNQPVVAHWVDQPETTWCGTVDLTAGQSLPIGFDFYDIVAEAVAKLTWSYPGQSTQVPVPSSALYAK